jgi:hypothetical protein
MGWTMNEPLWLEPMVRDLSQTPPPVVPFCFQFLFSKPIYMSCTPYERFAGLLEVTLQKQGHFQKCNAPAQIL